MIIDVNHKSKSQKQSMLTSVLATFDESKYNHVRTVLHELKEVQKVNVTRVVYGQLFEKMTASIFVSERELPLVFEKLVANDIHIFPYNEEYKQKIQETFLKVKGVNIYSKDKIRVYKNKIEELDNSRRQKKEIKKNDSLKEFVPAHKKEEINNRIESKKGGEVKSKVEINKQQDVRSNSNSAIDKLCKGGDYIAIKNIIKRNPLMNQYAKDKLVPAIKNCIEINQIKGMENRSYVDSAISKLREIVCDKDIKSITSIDLISLAGNALLDVCSAQDPDELLKVINLPNAGQKINVMAAIKVSELIFENEKVGDFDNDLLKLAAERINTRFILLSYDVMETVLSEINKNRFNKLMKTINEMKEGKK